MGVKGERAAALVASVGVAMRPEGIGQPQDLFRVALHEYDPNNSA